MPIQAQAKVDEKWRRNFTFFLTKAQWETDNATVLQCLLRQGKGDNLEGRTDYSLNNSASQTQSYESIQNTDNTGHRAEVVS